MPSWRGQIIASGSGDLNYTAALAYCSERSMVIADLKTGSDIREILNLKCGGGSLFSASGGQSVHTGLTRAGNVTQWSDGGRYTGGSVDVFPPGSNTSELHWESVYVGNGTFSSQNGGSHVVCASPVATRTTPDTPSVVIICVALIWLLAVAACLWTRVRTQRMKAAGVYPEPVFDVESQESMLVEEEKKRD